MLDSDLECLQNLQKVLKQGKLNELNLLCSSYTAGVMSLNSGILEYTFIQQFHCVMLLNILNLV